MMSLSAAPRCSPPLPSAPLFLPSPTLGSNNNPSQPFLKNGSTNKRKRRPTVIPGFKTWSTRLRSSVTKISLGILLVLMIYWVIDLIFSFFLNHKRWAIMLRLY
ncbi:hypothetical protein ABFX02_14G165100 [Erythranthe guttata]